MRKRSDIHTFEDEDFLRSMSRASVAAFIVGIAVALLCALALAVLWPELFDRRLMGVFSGGGQGFIDYLCWIAWVIVAAALSLGVHELVHGACFKAFAPRGTRVTFGANWKRGMLYASAEGIIYTRAQYMVIALAPTVVVTALLVAAGFACGCPVAGMFAAVLHLSGCTGDWCYVRELRRDPLITHCEDTAYGVCFYGEGDAAPGDDIPDGTAAHEDPADPAGEVRP